MLPRHSRRIEWYCLGLAVLLSSASWSGTGGCSQCLRLLIRSLRTVLDFTALGSWVNLSLSSQFVFYTLMKAFLLRFIPMKTLLLSMTSMGENSKGLKKSNTPQMAIWHSLVLWKCIWFLGLFNIFQLIELQLANSLKRWTLDSMTSSWSRHW